MRPARSVPRPRMTPARQRQIGAAYVLIAPFMILFATMIVVSLLALVANGFCLYLLQKSKSNEAHMQASAIFTSNDVVINLGVIAAGVLVYLFGSNKPDLIVGMIVFVVVVRGALRILKLGKRADG